MEESVLDLKNDMDCIQHIHVAEENQEGRRGFLSEKTYQWHQEAIEQLYRYGYRGTVSAEIERDVDMAGGKKNLEIFRRIETVKKLV